jgi:hypothetical protein
MRTLQALRRLNTTVRTVIVAIALLLAGALSLWASSAVSPATRPAKPGLISAARGSDVLGQLGSLLVGSAALAALWSVVAQRAFVEEMLGRLGAVESLEEGGLRALTFRFLEDIPWRELFDEAQSTDIVMAYGTGWRELNGAHLRRMIARRGTHIRVVLPDPDDDSVVRALAERFDTGPDQCRDHIRDAVEFFRSLRPVGHPDRVRIWRTRTPMLFTFYLIDRTALLALYTHQRGDADVPTFRCERGGTLFDFLISEFKALSDDAVATELK